MTELKVDTVVDLAGTGKPNFSTGVTMNGAALSSLNLGEYTASSSEPGSPYNGSVWWDTTNEKIFIYIDDEWKETIGIAATVWYGDRAIVHAGERSGSSSNTIDYFDITTTGNASDFGDSTSATAQGTAAGANNRTIFKLGLGSYTNTLEYVTPSTLGNCTDFGDTIQAGRDNSAVADGTYMLIHGGNFVNNYGKIDYVTIATTGNASAFGDCTVSPEGTTSAGDATRAVHKMEHGASNKTSVNQTIEYTTMATPGNATDFGDDSTMHTFCAAASGDGKFIVMGGKTYDTGSFLNTMSYVTIQTTGNASDRGDLSYSPDYFDATSNYSRGVAMGGRISGSSEVNTISYWSFSTTGNASDFGDLAGTSMALMAGSGSPS